MADLKITQLPSASVATGSNVLPIVQDGVTDQITVTNLGKGILELGLSITGSTITASGGFTGSLLGTASAAISSSYALSASYAPSSALPSGLISGSAQILGLGFPSTSSTDELSNKTLINPLIGSFKITSDGESRMGQYANNVEFFSKDGFLINPATTRAVFIDAYDDANKVVITSDLLSYARTGSTNTFYDNQTISGSLNITGSISITGSGTLNGGNILTSYDTGSFVTTSSYGYYGSFYSTQSQFNPIINTSHSMFFENLDVANGVSVVSQSQLTVGYPGTYNVQFSTQFNKSDNGTSNVYIWLKKNGVNLPDTAGDIQITKATGGPGGKYLAAWNYLVPMATDDFLEIVWQSDNVEITASSYTASGNIPAIPSTIVTLTQAG